jgi:acetate kinase
MFEAKMKILVCNAGSSSFKFSLVEVKTCQADADVAVPASAVRILVIAAREDLAIMRETRRLLTSTGEPRDRL